MNRLEKVKAVFPQKLSLLGVVHCENSDQTIQNVKIAVDNGLHGVFLINHGISGFSLIDVFKRTRERFEKVWIGMNILDFEPEETLNAVMELEGQLGNVGGVWVDNPQIRGVNPGYDNQDTIRKKIEETGWNGLYFGGVAFKYLEQPEDLQTACIEAQKYIDVITTSGPGTGKAADIEKIRKIRRLSGNHPIGLASGIDHRNIRNFGEYIDIAIVASSLNKDDDFNNFDPKKVEEMSKIVQDINKQ